MIETVYTWRWLDKDIRLGKDGKLRCSCGGGILEPNCAHLLSIPDETYVQVLDDHLNQLDPPEEIWALVERLWPGRRFSWRCYRNQEREKLRRGIAEVVADGLDLDLQPNINRNPGLSSNNVCRDVVLPGVTVITSILVPTIWITDVEYRYETMVFGGRYNEYQVRHRTIWDARISHQGILQMVIDAESPALPTPVPEKKSKLPELLELKPKRRISLL